MKHEQTMIPGVISKKKKYPKLTSVDDVPISRLQLSYNWMLEYASNKGTKEQCRTLLEFIEKNQITRESNLDRCKGETYTVTNIKALRNEFCKMFFPALAETKTPKKESQLEMARRLLGSGSPAEKGAAAPAKGSKSSKK